MEGWQTLWPPGLSFQRVTLFRAKYPQCGVLAFSTQQMPSPGNRCQRRGYSHGQRWTPVPWWQSPQPRTEQALPRCQHGLKTGTKVSKSMGQFQAAANTNVLICKVFETGRAAVLVAATICQEIPDMNTSSWECQPLPRKFIHVWPTANRFPPGRVRTKAQDCLSSWIIL